MLLLFMLLFGQGSIPSNAYVGPNSIAYVGPDGTSFYVKG